MHWYARWHRFWCSPLTKAGNAARRAAAEKLGAVARGTGGSAAGARTGAEPAADCQLARGARAPAGRPRAPGAARAVSRLAGPDLPGLPGRARAGGGSQLDGHRAGPAGSGRRARDRYALPALLDLLARRRPLGALSNRVRALCLRTGGE